MIDAKEKEKEQKEISKTVEESEARLIKFWGLLKTDLKAHGYDFLDRVSAKPFYSLGFWKGNAKFAYCIGRNAFRVELYFSNDPNKVLIDTMYKYKTEIETNFEGVIIWERLENKKASRIKFEMPSEIQYQLEGKFNDEKYWNELIVWYRQAMITFYNVINPFWEKVQKE